MDGLQELLNSLIYQNNYLKLEIAKQQKFARHTTIQLHMLRQNLDKNKQCIDRIQKKINENRGYDTI